ncbi:MAG: hypothetical protein AAGF12_19410 [Myxococcota bacterium]
MTCSRRLTTCGRLAPVAVLFLAGCGLPGTGGELVEVGWQLESAAADNVILTTGEDPWEVELVEARILVGPVYVFAPPTIAQRLAPLIDPLAPTVAHAHAGDDNTDGIRVRAELLEQTAVDLLDGSQSRMMTIAEAGDVNAVNIVLDQARSDLANESGPTRGFHAWLRGVATRRDERIAFSAGLGETIPRDAIASRVESVPIEGATALSDGDVLVVKADPREWVRRVIFDRIEAPATDEEIFIEEPSQLHNAWYIGLRDPASWSVSVRPAPLQN